jgi:hypothetical protein
LAALLIQSTCAKSSSSSTSTPTPLPATVSSLVFPGIDTITALGPSSATIQWTAITGAANYLVFQIINGSPVLLTTLSAATTSYIVTGLSVQSTYTYRVNLIDVDGKFDTNTNSVAYTTEGYLNAYSTAFNGTNASVTLPSPQTLLGTSNIKQFSLAFWMKEMTTPALFESPLGSVSSTAWGDGFGFYWSNANTLAFFVNDYSVKSTKPSITPGQWNFIVGVFDNSLGSGNIRIYVNGVAGSSGNQGASLAVPTSALRFGLLPGGVAFNGRMDEVSLWNVALSGTEITGLYNSGQPLDPRIDSGTYTQSAKLKAYWRMGDGDTAPTIADQISTHDGTMNNLTASDFSTDIP